MTSDGTKSTGGTEKQVGSEKWTAERDRATSGMVAFFSGFPVSPSPPGRSIGPSGRRGGVALHARVGLLALQVAAQVIGAGQALLPSPNRPRATRVGGATRATCGGIFGRAEKEKSSGGKQRNQTAKALNYLESPSDP